MPIISAGLLMYRQINSFTEVFLVHPGGPFFKNKDNGAWTIPKGIQEKEEDLLFTAQREFSEETGIQPLAPFINIGAAKLKSGKTIHAWAFETLQENIEIKSNTFKMEWPPKSGSFKDFPEIDKGLFFSLDEARVKLNEAQGVFLNRLEDHLKKTL